LLRRRQPHGWPGQAPGTASRADRENKKAHVLSQHGGRAEEEGEERDEVTPVGVTASPSTPEPEDKEPSMHRLFVGLSVLALALAVAFAGTAQAAARGQHGGQHGGQRRVVTAHGKHHGHATSHRGHGKGRHKVHAYRGHHTKAGYR